MSTQLQTQNRAMPQPSFTPVRAGLLQRQCACGQHNNGGECEECRKQNQGTLQRAAVNPAPVNNVPPIVHDVLSSLGQPLDAGTRAFMEPRFGHDFSGVRVHTDEKAADSARAVNALAYTAGRNVVFGPGQYAPDTIAGKRLLAHELTHVVQQVGSNTLQRQMDEEEIPPPISAEATVSPGPTPEKPVPSADEPEEKAISSQDDQDTDVVPDSIESLPEFTYVSEDVAPQETNVEGAAIAAMSAASTPTASTQHILPPDHPSEREAETVSHVIISDSAMGSIPAIDRTHPGFLQRQFSWDDRNALNWADFKAATPKDSPFDATTSSKMELPGSAPERDAQPNPQKPCKLGKKDDTEFTATLKIDPASINVRALMYPSESWVKAGKQSGNLLAHEQGHFDITHMIAGKAKTALVAWVNAHIAQVTKCGKNPALNAATKAWNAMKANDAIKAIWARAGALLDKAQHDYDNDTRHGLDAAQQKAWLGEIASGLKKYNL
jgi:uncharacterized protein DUF4157